jgi:hypothetical protein
MGDALDIEILAEGGAGAALFGSPVELLADLAGIDPVG